MEVSPKLSSGWENTNRREINEAIIAMQTVARRFTSLTIKLSIAVGAKNQTEVDDTARALAAEADNLKAAVKQAVAVLPSMAVADAELMSGSRGGH
jgi:hypothetical protein